MSPSANMFFERSASRGVTPSMPLSAPTVSDVNGTECSWYSASDPSSSGFVSYAAFCRLRSLNASELTISVPPLGRSLMFVFSAAGFIATSTLGASPGVRMSWSAKWSWKPLTPGSEPAGARISAGKSGRVERSLPKSAVSLVKRPPVSCIPSPESPANRMVTWSSCSTRLAITPVARYSRVRTGRSASGGADDRQAPGLFAREELVRVDLLAPAEKMARGIGLGRAVDRELVGRALVRPVALELVAEALGLLGGWTLCVALAHTRDAIGLS